MMQFQSAGCLAFSGLATDSRAAGRAAPKPARLCVRERLQCLFLLSTVRSRKSKAPPCSRPGVRNLTLAPAGVPKVVARSAREAHRGCPSRLANMFARLSLAHVWCAAGRWQPLESRLPRERPTTVLHRARPAPPSLRSTDAGRREAAPGKHGASKRAGPQRPGRRCLRALPGSQRHCV